MTPLRDELLTICRRITSGEVEPRAGASRIWLLMTEADYPSDVDDLRILVGLISEIQDHPGHAAEYTKGIREEARAVVERHDAA